MLITLLIILLLVFCSGFFSGSETALTAASRAKIHRLATEGSKSAKKAFALRENKEGLIGTILLGNNAVNILASALATSLAIEYLGDEGVVVATIAMTLLVLVFAEVLPKTYAFYHAERVAVFVAPVFYYLVKIFGPVTGAVQIAVNATMHVFGMKKESNDVMSGADALRGAIALHHREDSMLKTYRHMLDSVLDLAETEVCEVMTHRKNIFTLDIDLPTDELVDQVLESSHTRIPLYKDSADNIVGVLHVRDVLKLRAKSVEVKKRALKAVIKEPWFIPETIPLSKQLGQFRDRKSHLAIVVDEYGDLVGLVTLEDILEEIVGEIEDEYDQAEVGIRKLKGNAYRVDGELSVKDVNRRLDWGLPGGEAATIAGLVINELESIPEEGVSFMLYGYEFKVLKKHGNQLTSLKIRRLKRKNA